MRQPSTTRHIDHPPGIAAPAGSETEVGHSIDDPSPGERDPGPRGPLAPEVDGPARPLDEPLDEPGSEPAPAIDPPAPGRLSRFESVL
jgi:hypothetical protein